MSTDTYGTGDRNRFHWCAKDERGEATAFFIACAGQLGADWLEPRYSRASVAGFAYLYFYSRDVFFFATA